MGRVAAIDIGTNSVRMLVAQVDGFCIALYRVCAPPGWAQGGRRWVLSPQNVQTTLRAVGEFREKAFSMGAGRIEVCATSDV